MKSLLFIPYSIEGEVPQPLHGVGWTLNYEMFFYALFAVALLLPRARGLALLFSTMGVLVAAGMTGLVDGGPVANFYVNSLLGLFAVGVAIGYFETHLHLWRRHVPGRTAAAVFAVTVGVAAVTLAANAESSLAWWTRFLAVPVMLVMLCSTSDAASVSPPGRLLELGGDASYSTYPFHSFVLSAAGKVWFRLPFPGAVDAAGFVIVGVVAANAAGYAAHRLVERPVTHALRPRQRLRT